MRQESRGTITPWGREGDRGERGCQDKAGNRKENWVEDGTGTERSEETSGEGGAAKLVVEVDGKEVQAAVKLSAVLGTEVEKSSEEG